MPSGTPDRDQCLDQCARLGIKDRNTKLHFYHAALDAAQRHAPGSSDGTTTWEQVGRNASFEAASKRLPRRLRFALPLPLEGKDIMQAEQEGEQAAQAVRDDMVQRKQTMEERMAKLRMLAVNACRQKVQDYNEGR